MAAGTPVIASRFAALPEVVGEASILVDATQPAEILTALLSLQNVKTREQHRQLGFRRARQFTWEACASRLLASMKLAEQNK
jgi:glycosyltransferase involved in cell wall biosynthesis